MSDDCANGRNGCYTLQELQKDMIKLSTEKDDIKSDVVNNGKSISNINKIIYKQASLIGLVTALIQIIFKFWK